MTTTTSQTLFKRLCGEQLLPQEKDAIDAVTGKRNTAYDINPALFCALCYEAASLGKGDDTPAPTVEDARRIFKLTGPETDTAARIMQMVGSSHLPVLRLSGLIELARSGVYSAAEVAARAGIA